LSQQLLLEGITAQQIFDDNIADLKLSWISGLEGADRTFDSQAVKAAAASSDLVGHLNMIHPSRIQIFGEVIDHLRFYLTKIGAPCSTMHGVFMDILGLGVLITGESGLGKSELGLELISRGHGLVADDAVDFTRLGPDYIEGRCPEILRDLLEVRGLGLLDIRTIFGETAVRRKLKLRLIVQLVRRNDGEFERLPIESQFINVLDVPIRTVKIQVAAGRNLAVLVEAAVRNTILQLRGIDTLKDFIERQRNQMSLDSENNKNQGRLL